MLAIDLDCARSNQGSRLYGQFIGCQILDGLRTDPDGATPPFSEALYSLQLQMWYVCFFMAEKAYHVTPSATLHSVSCDKANNLSN